MANKSLRLIANEGLDSITNANKVIEYEHHEIHNGSHYFLCVFEIVDEDEVIDFVVESPDTAKWLHMLFDAQGTTQTEIFIYEGSTVSEDGTIVTPQNNNRNSSKTSVAVIRKNPTIGADGTLIFSASSGKEGITPARANSSGLIGRNKELILKQNTKYVIRLISRGDGNIVSYCGEWYEHTNKNTE